MKIFDSVKTFVTAHKWVSIGVVAVIVILIVVVTGSGHHLNHAIK